MKDNIIKWAALIGKVAGIVSSGSAYAGAIPEKYQWIGILVFGAASILKDTVNRIADLADDGQINNSIK